jgi:uncharacterized protein
MKTTVIHHSADYDGIFCREIARVFIPGAEIIGWDFPDKPLDDALLRQPLVIMDLPVDRPFGLEFKGGWICKGGDQKQPIDRWDSSNLIWIDHHASSIMTHPASIPGYRIDGVAACRLAWQWFQENSIAKRTGEAVRLPEKQHFVNRSVGEPIAVRLAGEYDIWDKRDPDAELFQHGLRSQELGKDDWFCLLSYIGSGRVDRLLEQGRCVQYAQRNQDEFVAKNRSFDVEFEGLKFMAINAVRCNSLTFEAATRPDHDALIGFYWNGKCWNVSMYHAPHRKDLDLSAIAVKYGGGGHRGACGFRAQKLPFIP